jgi:metal-sulfur cluster biosynthetic enzyme
MTDLMRVTKKAVLNKLEEVLDPEMGISIVDLGLIYKVTITKKNKVPSVHILMTLTTMGCPLFGVIEDDIYMRLADLNLQRSHITVEMTFDPPWDLTRMSKRAKAVMGI